jgi:hypothetical protein
MLAAVLLASLWAQAEQAPAPAPAPPKQSLAKPAPSVPANGVSVHARFAYRVGSEGRNVGPAAGFSLGGTFERRYLATRRGIELGVAGDFFYDRFSTDVTGSAPDASGQEMTFPSERTLSQTSFALLQTVGWRATELRVFVGVGPGLTIGYFSSPELALRPGSTNAAQPLARGMLGVEFALSALTAVIVRADYTHAFTRPTFTTETAAQYSLFGDLFDAGAGLLVHF